MNNTIISHNLDNVKQLQDKIFKITPKRFLPLIRRKFLDANSDTLKLAENLKAFITSFSEGDKAICDLDEHDRKIELVLKFYELVNFNDKRNIYRSKNDFDNTVKLIELTENTELKMKAIPEDLLEEVRLLVNRKHLGDWQAYFDTVELYFSVFTVHKLFVANLNYTNLFKAKDSNLETEKFKKRLKRLRKSYLFHASVLLKLVGKGGKYYCSNTLFNEFRADKIKEQRFIKSNVLIGTDGKVFPLSQVTKTAEKAIAEKMNIIRTMEQIADDKEWIWAFITLTLPGHLHPNPANDAKTYDGTSPKDSAIYMNQQVKRVRALMAKRGILASVHYHGCSSSETHKDGCIHKHLIVFASKEMMERIKKAFFETFDNLEEDDKSFVIESEENRNKPYIQSGDKYVKGKFRIRASSYVFKYVMKSISHFDADLEIMSITEESNETMYNNMLNNAFRSYNCIRGFSFFGIENCLTKFRFLACNLKKMNLPAMFELLVQENNLYELIKGGYFDDIENIYSKIEIKDGDLKVVGYSQPKFIGCRYNNMNFVKNFFQMVRKAVVQKNEAKFTENEPKFKQFARLKEEAKHEPKRLEAVKQAIDDFGKVAMIGEAKYLNSLGLCSLVILNPNDTREQQKNHKATSKEHKVKSKFLIYANFEKLLLANLIKS